MPSLELDRLRLSGVTAASLWGLASALAIFGALYGGTGSPPPTLESVTAVATAGALVCGALPAIVLGRWPPVIRVAALVVADLLVSRLIDWNVPWAAAPGPSRLVLLALVALPAQLFADWTTQRRRLVARNILHALGYVLLLAWDLPWLLITVGDGSLSAWNNHAPWVRSLVLQLFCLPGVIGLTALTEYTSRGRGSPMPLDPPTHLVITGPFAYVANPLQLAKVLAVATWAVLAWSWTILGAAAMLAAIGALVTEPHEHAALAHRFGPAWQRYRDAVRAWIPRWRPWRDASVGAARLRLRDECGPCLGLARWFVAHHPTGLIVESCEQTELAQVEYRDGPLVSTGVVALARALEHVNLAWALFGWCVRLPGISWVAKIIYSSCTGRTDAVTTQSRTTCRMPTSTS